MRDAGRGLRPASNQLAAQKAALEASPELAAVPVAAGATAAVDTDIFAAASQASASVRAVRGGTELVPTGKREGLFVKVTDNYGTRGRVSAEDLK